MEESIIKYIRQHGRNKIIIHRNTIEDIAGLNLGKLLAMKIAPYVNDRKFSFKVYMALEELLEESIVYHKLFGSYLAIENLGILFEQGINIDVENLFDKYSQNNVLFIRWPGEINEPLLYFLSMQNGKKLNVNKYSHIIL